MTINNQTTAAHGFKGMKAARVAYDVAQALVDGLGLAVRFALNVGVHDLLFMALDGFSQPVQFRDAHVVYAHQHGVEPAFAPIFARPRLRPGRLRRPILRGTT